MPALGWRFPSEVPDFNPPLGWPTVMNVLSWAQHETKTNPVVESEHQSRQISGFLNWFLQSHNRKARKVIFKCWMLTVLIFWFNIPDSRGASLITLTGQLLIPLLLTPFRAWCGHFTHEGLWGGHAFILRGHLSSPQLQHLPISSRGRLFNESLLWMNVPAPRQAGHTLWLPFLSSIDNIAKCDLPPSVIISLESYDPE